MVFCGFILKALENWSWTWIRRISCSREESSDDYNHREKIHTLISYIRLFNYSSKPHSFYTSPVRWKLWIWLACAWILILTLIYASGVGKFTIAIRYNIKPCQYIFLMVSGNKYIDKNIYIYIYIYKTLDSISSYNKK